MDAAKTSPITNHERKCPSCDTLLSASILGGQCPGCMVQILRKSAIFSDGSLDSWSAGSMWSAPEGVLRFFGNYELLTVIGRGGMGVVYKARDLVLGRMVALKLIASEHLISPKAVERFHAEAEAVANLEHPHIVPIYETGRHEGRHYFSMKLIEGRTLADWIREGKFSVGDNFLRNGASGSPRRSKHSRQCAISTLMGQVAAAVHCAHQHAILHRDLKPGNVLIDENGDAHVADFGLAKDLDVESGLTLSGEVLGTPAYMSPEQASGYTGKITTSSDVYSLGVILYELLTGHPPFQRSTPVETLHALLYEDPRPPHQAAPWVDRDLETICLKCLEKEPVNRYTSAQELADDLARFSRGELIQARTISPTEKLWRWCRRQPALATLVTITSFLLIAVLIGAPIALLQINRARETAATNERTAKAEAARSSQVARFVKAMLEGVGPSVAQGRDTTLLREILDQTSERIGRELADQPAVEAELRTTIGSSYQQLGRHREAETMFRRALYLHQTFLGSHDASVAHLLSEIGEAVQRQARFPEAETLAREALAIQRKAGSDQAPAAVRSLENLAYALFWQNRLGEAETLYREALGIRREREGNQSANVSKTLDLLGLVMVDQGNLEEAERTYQESLAILQKLPSPEPLREANLSQNLGVLYRKQSRLPETETAFRKSMEIRQRILGEDHPVTQMTIQNYVAAALDLGRRAEVEEMVSQGMFRRPQSAFWLRIRGGTHARAGRWRDALSDLLGASEREPDNHWTWFQVAILFVQIGDLEGYRNHRRRMIERFGSTESVTTLRRIAKVSVLVSSSTPETDLAGIRLSDVAVSADPHWGAFTKGLLEYRLGRHQNAVEWANKGLGNHTHLIERDPALHAYLAMAHYRLNEVPQARASLASARDLIAAKFPKLEQGDIGGLWHDWLIAQILFREASELIEPRTTR